LSVAYARKSGNQVAQLIIEIIRQTRQITPKLRGRSVHRILVWNAVLVHKFGEGLQFDEYFVVADKIGEISLVESSASIFKGQSGLRDCWDAAILEFNAKTFLIHRLVEAAALVFVNFEAGANNGITFLLEDKVSR
jgi:hypothetical protein